MKSDRKLLQVAVLVFTLCGALSAQTGSITGAGVISLVSKSGTNRFHGEVFGVFRPDALSANEYFNKQTQLSQGQQNSPPAFHRYQEGGAIGGPIKKDKVFFFGDYEDTQHTEFEGVDYFDVPTAADRTGDFSKMGLLDRRDYEGAAKDFLSALQEPIPAGGSPRDDRSVYQGLSTALDNLGGVEASAGASAARVLAENATDGCQHYELAKYLDKNEASALEVRITEYEKAVATWNSSRCGDEAYVFKDLGCALAKQGADPSRAVEYLKKSPPDDKSARYLSRFD